VAKKLEEFDFESDTVIKSSKYAWDEWLNGDIWQLVEHVDFKVKRASFKITVLNNAKKRGLKVNIAEVEDGFVVQAFKSKRGRPRKATS
jgi:hypothetical protein